jgi:hypothetical protein
LIIRLAETLQVQMYEVVKGADPTTHICICGGDDRNAPNVESESVVGGRVGRIRKRLFPQLDVRCPVMEFDASKEVGSRPMNPGFGDDATRLERRRFVVQVVDDMVEDLWREGGRHRGLS